MMRLKNILLPTDLSQRSKRSLRYALSLATEYSATITVVHVANELNSWELYCDEFSFMIPVERAWPVDRVVAEASLELSNFLEPYRETIKRLPAISKRVVLGPIADEIVSAAEDLQADLIVMSPRRLRGVKRILTPSITDQVMRISPCGLNCDRSSSLPALAREAYNQTIRLAKTKVRQCAVMTEESLLDCDNGRTIKQSMVSFRKTSYCDSANRSMP